jgi:hypothetical protein
MPKDELKAEVERLRQENAALRKGTASSPSAGRCRVGLRPGTVSEILYKEHWLKAPEHGARDPRLHRRHEAALKVKAPR